MSEWISTTIGNVCDVVRNGCTNVQVEYISKYPVSRIETISNGVIDYEKIGYAEGVSGDYLIQKGDILLSHINSLKHIGKIAIKKDSKVLYHGMNLLLLRVNRNYNRDFIFYVLSHIKPYFEKIANSAINQASINQSEIQKSIIQIPKLITAQDHISNILITCDTVIERTQSAIFKYKAIKQGMLHDLFTRGLDVNGKLRPRYQDAPELYKETELGLIPREWEVKRLGNFCDINPKTIELPHSFIYIDLESVEDGKLNSENYILKKDAPSRAQRCLAKEDVLYQMVRPYQKNNLYFDKNIEHIKYVASTGYAQLRAKGSSLFLFYLLHTDLFVNEVLIRCTGSNYPAINSSELQFIYIAIPSDIEQYEIGKRLQILDNKLKIEEALLQKYQKVKRGLMGDLLGGKKKVKN